MSIKSSKHERRKENNVNNDNASFYYFIIDRKISNAQHTILPGLRRIRVYSDFIFRGGKTLNMMYQDEISIMFI